MKFSLTSCDIHMIILVVNNDDDEKKDENTGLRKDLWWLEFFHFKKWKDNLFKKNDSNMFSFHYVNINYWWNKKRTRFFLLVCVWSFVKASPFFSVSISGAIHKRLSQKINLWIFFLSIKMKIKTKNLTSFKDFLFLLDSKSIRFFFCCCFQSIFDFHLNRYFVNSNINTVPKKRLMKKKYVKFIIKRKKI